MNLDRSLTNQPPVNDLVVATFEDLRVHAKAFGAAIENLVPYGREQAIAVTKLEETLMWAIKGVALNQDKIAR